MPTGGKAPGAAPSPPAAGQKKGRPRAPFCCFVGERVFFQFFFNGLPHLGRDLRILEAGLPVGASLVLLLQEVAVEHPQAVTHRGVVPQDHHLFQGRGRFLRLALVVQDDTQHVEGLGIVDVQSHGTLGKGGRGVPFLGGHEVFGQMHQGILVGGLGGHLLHQAGQQALFLSHALRGRGAFGHQMRIADAFLDGDAQHDQQAQAQQQDDGAGGEGKTAISHAGSPSGADGHPDAAGHSP